MEYFIERVDKKEGAVRLTEGAASLGRHPKNNIVLAAEEKSVSGYHALVYVDPDRLLLQDLQSTNGTFVNGRQVNECVVREGDEIGLGKTGPRFRVVCGGKKNVGKDGADGHDGVSGRVGIVDRDGGIAGSGHRRDKACLVSANVNANDVNVNGGQTGASVPAALTASRIITPKIIIPSIIAVILLTVVISFILFSGNTPKPSAAQKDFFSARQGQSYEEPDNNPGHASRSNKHSDKSVEGKIDAILQRFGEGGYHAPPEMVERVSHYLDQYSGKMKRTISMYMERRKRYFPMIRRVFTEKNIPLDLAYVSILESGLDPQALSHAGARGLWQFMPKTARGYGLEVSDSRDDRTDPEKATYAAAAYFKDLIAIFGSKSSVMLCMAAYNAGENRVINALKRIEDPVKDRDFWYLYKMGWLAEETNEYIPQVLALIIISENPEEYGFEP